MKEKKPAKILVTVEELRNAFICSQIKLYRQKADLTRQELSEKMGYKSLLSISNLERGKYDLSISQLYKLGDILDFKPKDMLGEVEKMLEMFD